MTSAVCYCDTCQEGSARIEALPDAPPARDADGGTAYVLYRKDRIVCANGEELLAPLRLDERSTTSRVVARCCNSAMIVRFDDAKHWVPVYRARLLGELPPVQWRICTQFAPDRSAIAGDAPSSSLYPPGFMWQLLRSKIAMMLRA